MNVCSAWKINAWNVSAAGSSTSINPTTSQRSSIAEGGLYRLLLLLPTVAVWMWLAPVAAAAVTGWTPAQAAAKVKATYTTVDQKAYDFAKEHGYTDAMRVQLHAAKPTSVSCKGAGAATAGRYSRFHCVVQVQGSARIPPDYELYTATKKLTVTVVPFRVLAGWR